MLPEGRLLPEEVWLRRHRAIVRVAGLQAAVLLVAFAVQAALAAGGTDGSGHAGGHGGVLPALDWLIVPLLVAAPLPLAHDARRGRQLRAGAAATSLFVASTALVHLAGGITEAHFHFFVMVGLVALYQDWVPFGVGLAITVGHHGILGSLHPRDVYGTEAAVHNPWLWAAVHGGFVLAASAVHLAAWRLNEQQGLHDALTGLANRTLLGEVLDRRLRTGDPVSVLFIDLDDFKEINDSRGHPVGDHVLKIVAERLRGCVRGDDVVARLGGDEFAIVATAPSAVAHEIGERVRRAVQEPMFLEGYQLCLSASVGVADSTTADLGTADELIRNADLAMYLAKAAGKREMVVFSQGMDDAVKAKAELTTDLAGALDSGALHVHYQPTVVLAGGDATGFEALLRWDHPTRGSVPPAEFIPLAEETVHIHAIGAWVLRTAVLQAQEWTIRSGRPIGIAVNLSPRQLADDRILGVVATALADSGLRASQLTLEVTEGVLVRDLDAAAVRLAALRAMGVRIAVDDFGTGYAGLSYLTRLPVDVVKIDRSFVQRLGSGADATTLVRSIIDLAHSLHLDVVAEGVETVDEAEMLQAMRCQRAQGYLYSRPLPPAQIQRDGLVDRARPVAAALV